MKLGSMRETRTIRQKLSIRVRQIFNKLKGRDIKRYQPINIFSSLKSIVMISKNSLLCHSLFFPGSKFEILRKRSFVSCLVCASANDVIDIKCNKLRDKLLDGYYTVQGLMITWHQKKISVPDGINRHGVTAQLVANMLHKAKIRCGMTRSDAKSRTNLTRSLSAKKTASINFTQMKIHNVGKHLNVHSEHCPSASVKFLMSMRCICSEMIFFPNYAKSTCLRPFLCITYDELQLYSFTVSVP